MAWDDGLLQEDVAPPRELEVATRGVHGFGYFAFCRKRGQQASAFPRFKYVSRAPK